MTNPGDLWPAVLSRPGDVRRALRTASFSVVAMSDVALKNSEVAAGVAEALLLPFAGMLLAGPSYLVATIGLICRALQGQDR